MRRRRDWKGVGAEGAKSYRHSSELADTGGRSSSGSKSQPPLITRQMVCVFLMSSNGFASSSTMSASLPTSNTRHPGGDRLMGGAAVALYGMPNGDTRFCASTRFMSHITVTCVVVSVPAVSYGKAGVARLPLLAVRSTSNRDYGMFSRPPCEETHPLT